MGGFGAVGRERGGGPREGMRAGGGVSENDGERDATGCGGMESLAVRRFERTSAVLRWGRSRDWSVNILLGPIVRQCNRMRRQ